MATKGYKKYLFSTTILAFAIFATKPQQRHSCKK